MNTLNKHISIFWKFYNKCMFLDTYNLPSKLNRNGYEQPNQIDNEDWDWKSRKEKLGYRCSDGY